MGMSFSSGCVFIFYIVFSFSFCLLQTFVIRGYYLIEKKNLALCHIKILKVTERIDIKVVKRFAVFCVDKLIIAHVQMPAQGC